MDHSESINDAAKRVFGISSVRPHQRTVLDAVLSGHDALAVLPTGSGKSLCYGLPAVLRPGLVLVVSPLIALIRDQLRRFEESGVPCVALDSLQTPEERDIAWRRITSGEARVLIVSPERLARPDFRQRLARVPIQLVAVDEAHCVSHWGQHFRPDYRLLGDYLDKLTQADGTAPQKLAVTATATGKVRDDIARLLHLKAPTTVWADFQRHNLKLKVVRGEKVADQFTLAIQAVLGRTGSGIIYVPTRKNAELVHRMYVDAGLSASLYHAGLHPTARQAAQKDFITGKTQLVVATHAFGMGIDKADIRFVHHIGLPGSLEQYVQEIGRAGRDGDKAECWLIHSARDYHIRRFMIEKSLPPVERLSEALVLAQRLIGQTQGLNSRSLLTQLTQQTKIDTRELSELVNILCREGALVELKASGAYGDEILIADGTPELAAEMLRDYPSRQAEQMHKLDAMRTYVGLSSDRSRSDFLDTYFRG